MMKVTQFYAYSVLLGIGAALVGLVVGLLIKPPTAAITSVLLVIGVLFIAGAILLARRLRKRAHKKD